MDRNRITRRKTPPTVSVPRPSPRLLNAFQWYTRGYLRRAFHTVRLAHEGYPMVDDPEQPLLVYLNHPAWWDPLLCLFLSRTLFPHRDHYAPRQATALQRYRIFTRFGFFGIDTATQRGAATFLRTSHTILSRPQTAFKILLQGNAGVGGIYDRWRAIRARLRGESFHKAHGTEIG